MTSHKRNGWQWGPFTFRLPFYHTRLVWPEFLQGLLVSTATDWHWCRSWWAISV